jgi:predicted PurR-regulated permease PerM
MVVGALVLPSLVAQAEALRRDLPDKLSEAQQVLLSAGVLRRPITTLNEAVEQAPVSDGATALTTLWLTLRNVMGGVLGLVTVLLLTFYMLVESRELRAFFVRLFPPRARARVKLVSGAVVSKVSAWMSAQALLAVIIGLTSALGLWIMGVPYFYVLAVISAVGELIPMVGPLVAAIPAVLVAATVSTGLAIGVTIFFIAQQQLENTVLVPKIMGHQVGLGAVTVIVALAIGTQLFGILGAVLSVPTAAIVQVLFDELVARDD